MHDPVHLRKHRSRAVDGRTGRQLHDGKRITLVLFRQEAARQPPEQQDAGHEYGAIDYEPARRAPARRRDTRATYPFAVRSNRRLKRRRSGLAGIVRRLEQRGTQRRRETQCHGGGKEHRDRDGERELPVYGADAAAPCIALGMKTAASTTETATMAPVICCIDLRVASLGTQPLLSHDALDVLDDHDGVVHHDADGQHEPEEAQHVDRKPERGTCRRTRQGWQQERPASARWWRAGSAGTAGSPGTPARKLRSASGPPP